MKHRKVEHKQKKYKKSLRRSTAKPAPKIIQTRSQHRNGVAAGPSKSSAKPALFLSDEDDNTTNFEHVPDVSRICTLDANVHNKISFYLMQPITEIQSEFGNDDFLPDGDEVLYEMGILQRTEKNISPTPGVSSHVLTSSPATGNISLSGNHPSSPILVSSDDDAKTQSKRKRKNSGGSDSEDRGWRTVMSDPVVENPWKRKRTEDTEDVVNPA